MVSFEEIRYHNAFLELFGVDYPFLSVVPWDQQVNMHCHEYFMYTRTTIIIIFFILFSLIYISFPPMLHSRSLPRLSEQTAVHTKYSSDIFSSKRACTNKQTSHYQSKLQTINDADHPLCSSSFSTSARREEAKNRLTWNEKTIMCTVLPTKEIKSCNAFPLWIMQCSNGVNYILKVWRTFTWMDRHWELNNEDEYIKNYSNLISRRNGFSLCYYKGNCTKNEKLI